MNILRKFAGYPLLKCAKERLRPNITRVSALELFICLAAIALIWYFDIIDEVVVKLLATLLIAIVLVVGFYSAPTGWHSRGDRLWLAALAAAALVLTAGDRLSQDLLAVSGVLALIIIGLWWLAWRLMAQQWWLATGLTLASTLMMTYWIAALLKSREAWDQFLLPLVIVVSAAVVWAPIGWLIYRGAIRWKYRRIVGYGLQALAMMWLFLPMIVVAIVVPPALKLGDLWGSASLAFAGFLMSAVVADPLRRFFLEWGNLDR